MTEVENGVRRALCPAILEGDACPTLRGNQANQVTRLTVLRCPRANQQSVDLPGAAANQSPLVIFSPSRSQNASCRLPHSLSSTQQQGLPSLLVASPKRNAANFQSSPLVSPHPLFSPCPTLLLPTFFLRQRRWLSRRHVETVRHLVHIFFLLR